MDVLRVVTTAFLLATACLIQPRDLLAQGLAQRTVAEAAAYLELLRDRMAGVVLEEHYAQVAQARTGPRRQRTLRSDVTVITDVARDWVEFRDVFEVDGSAVRDRQDRIVAIFTEPQTEAPALAKKIVAEGARYNLGPDDVAFERTLNVPLGALLFLTREHQGRVRFTSSGSESLSGRTAVVLRFEEVDTPRLIGSPDGAPSRGTFWIEAGTGRILQSELQMSSRRDNVIVSANVRVSYTAVEGENVWLPGSMEEDYTFMDLRERRIASVSGRAAYSNMDSNRRYRLERAAC